MRKREGRKGDLEKLLPLLEWERKNNQRRNKKKSNYSNSNNNSSDFLEYMGNPNSTLGASCGHHLTRKMLKRRGKRGEESRGLIVSSAPLHSQKERENRGFSIRA